MCWSSSIHQSIVQIVRERAQAPYEAPAIDVGSDFAVRCLHIPHRRVLVPWQASARGPFVHTVPEANRHRLGVKGIALRIVQLAQP